MSVSMFSIVLWGVAAVFLFWVTYKTRKEIKRMEKLQPKTDILLELSAPVPFSLAGLVILPFLLIEYYVPDPSFKFIPVSVGCILSFVFIVIYSLMRVYKNKLNNEYLEKCINKGVDFIPGNLFAHPIIKDKPWSKKDLKRVVFVNRDALVNELIGKSEEFTYSPKAKLNGFFLLLGIFVGACFILLIVQYVFIGEVHFR